LRDYYGLSGGYSRVHEEESGSSGEEETATEPSIKREPGTTTTTTTTTPTAPESTKKRKREDDRSARLQQLDDHYATILRNIADNIFSADSSLAANPTLWTAGAMRQMREGTLRELRKQIKLMEQGYFGRRSAKDHDRAVFTTMNEYFPYRGSSGGGRYRNGGKGVLDLDAILYDDGGNTIDLTQPFGSLMLRPEFQGLITNGVNRLNQMCKKDFTALELISSTGVDTFFASFLVMMSSSLNKDFTSKAPFKKTNWNRSSGGNLTVVYAERNQTRYTMDRNVVETLALQEYFESVFRDPSTGKLWHTNENLSDLRREAEENEEPLPTLRSRPLSRARRLEAAVVPGQSRQIASLYNLYQYS